ncbi:flagellar assembly protein FliH [Helicobacter sp. 16-1353]|uniref:flagellar assembly protein FliH n=1 Tax=Helicobacter sp. 16-1353 TaxID=2004996 RepID=UPI0015EE4C70|nr:flagellar assembly protein FliH [Helicobacter sp. 16-1353]
MNNNDKSIISLQELDGHNMKKYEFKKIDMNDIKIQETKNTNEDKMPTQTQVSMIQSSLEKELIEKLLIKSDELANSFNNLQMQFEKLQSQTNEKEKIAREEGFKEGELKAQLSFKDSLENEKEKIAKSLVTLDDTIENAKKQIVKLESELSAIALDIAKEVIVKEVDANSAKIAALISKELLQSMSANLNIIIKVNPIDFDFLNNLVKNKQNIKIKSDDAIQKGGVVVISENGNIDGNVMSRYQILKQNVLENFRS